MKITLVIFAILCMAVPSHTQVSISETGNPPDPKAILDITSTDKGLLPPRMTTAQRNAITSPIPMGLTIYNTDHNCFNSYNGSQWLKICGCAEPGSFSAGSHSGIDTQITWNWTASGGAQGYKYNTTNNYLTAVSIGNVTSFVQTNLLCESPYTLYVWAYNDCGETSSVQLSASTGTCAPSFSCGSSISVTHSVDAVSPASKTVSYGTTSYDRKCWTTRNLGSDNIASSATDGTEAAGGWYWQFNRKQGYRSGPVPSWTITSINQSSNWVSGEDPCLILLGTGWRIPTQAEWISADATGGWTTAANTFGSVLKLHAAGYLETSNGSLSNRGSVGYYWTGTQSDSSSGYLFRSNNADIDSDNKAFGYPIRCVSNL